MSDQRIRSLVVLARIQAIIGALTAVVIFGLYGLKPELLPDASVSLTAAILGALAAVYFVTLHQVLKGTHLVLSSLILSMVIGINLLLVITSTGGLDSPFYSFWLLAIVVTGIFGVPEIMTIAGLTIVYYCFQIIAQGLHARYINDHLVELGITLAAAGLAVWISRRSDKATAVTTKLERVSGQLSTEQLKADAIMSSIGEGVMVVDSTRRIQLFNKAAQDLTGWDESSAQSIDYNLVLQLKTADDKDLTDVNDPFAESWRKGQEVIRDNIVMTTRGGHKIQLNISVSPIFDANAHPTGAIALFRDISKEKEVERQKDEFVSTASHEMRTPVAAIEGYISLAMNANVATIDERAQKYLGKAHEAIQHLGELFRDLLSVTKAEENQLGGRMEAVDLGHLLQGAVDDMQFTVKQKNLTLVYQIGGQSGKAISPLYHVAANPERLREVVMNLIDNAKKFTLEGGIKVVLDGSEKEVTVSISDTGLGIAPEDAGHLFQKFYRIDSTATRTIGGTGLGLYLCRRLIEAFNGRIWVESKIGQGSTFKFTLPRLSQTEVEKMQSAAPADQAAAGTAPTNAPAAPAAPVAAAETAPAPNTPAPAAMLMPIPTDSSEPTPEAGPALSPTPAPATSASDRPVETGVALRIR